MAIEPDVQSRLRVAGRPVRLPPGSVEVRLGPEHRIAYRTLYASYQSYLAGLPVLRDRDFDGRPVRLRRPQLDALNRAFASLCQTPSDAESGVFGAQERGRKRLFKRLQFLS